MMTTEAGSEEQNHLPSDLNVMLGLALARITTIACTWSIPDP